MIARIEMTNCGPFRGHHVIELGPGAYAVTARHELDPKRSNAIGKSFLFETINFALTGKWRKERRFDADGWITHGEREGRVVLVLSDSTRVERWKTVGQPRQTRVHLPGRDVASQDAAADALFRHLGFDADDFKHASYFEQREAARLVHADPGDRLSIVTAWFGLTLGENAEKEAGDRAAELVREGERLATRRNTLAELAKASAPEVDEEALQEEIDKLRALIAKCEDVCEAASAKAAAQAVIDAQEARIEKGKALRAEVDAAGDVDAEAKTADDAHAAARAKLDAARAEVNRKKSVALGLFDGACPVAPIECPAKDRINKDRASAKVALAGAKDAYAKAEVEYERVRKETEAKRLARVKISGKRIELEGLRKEVRSNADKVKASHAVIAEIEKKVDRTLDPDEAARRADEAREHLREHEYALRSAREAKARREKHAADLAKAVEEAKVALERQMRALKGKSMFRAATRRVAERALTAVEKEANEAIADAGIPLQVRARWEREGKGAAKTCDACGAAFPTSTKVKTCERCGEPRGQLTSQRLDFVLSDSSGAYDDMAGIAWQLSAGSWLLAHRQSPWATALLDEPTSQMDHPARRGLVRYLSKLTSRPTSVYRQLFVISHSGDTVDALPRRITVVCDAKGNRTIEQT